MAQLNFHIPDPLLARLDAAKPDYLDRKGFLCLLLDQALDNGVKLGKPSTAQAVPPEGGEGFTSKAVSSSSSSLITSNKERDAVKSRKRTEVTPEFQEWWRLYLSTPLTKRVPSQTKPKAWAAWQRAVKDYTPEQLMAATEEAIKQVKAMAGDYRMPDAARWLSEARYEALIDVTAPAQGLEAETYEETQRRIFGHHA